jgi:hypothetical protein
MIGQGSCGVTGLLHGQGEFTHYYLILVGKYPQALDAFDSLSGG